MDLLYTRFGSVLSGLHLMPFSGISSHYMQLAFSGMAPLLQVFDMPASLAFYRDILGFRVVESSGPGDDVDWVLLRCPGGELMLNTAYEKPYRPSQPEANRMAYHEDTSLYFGCPDVEGVYEFLLAKGLSPAKPTIAPYGMKQLYLKDPDGYLLCFQYPATEAQKAAWAQRYVSK